LAGQYDVERRVALDAVREAALLCQAVQGELASAALEKKDRSPVTVADFGSQALICRALGEAFPDDLVIAEEGSAILRLAENAPILQRVIEHVGRYVMDCDEDGVCGWIDRGAHREYADRFWTLDPIDGTKGFLRGEQYAVALALIEEGQVVLGAMACPNLESARGSSERGVAFVAVRGEGAVVVPLTGEGPETPIRVSQTTDAARSRFCESIESAHSAHGDSAKVADMLGVTLEPVRLDSQAKYAMVARGEADIYMRLPTRQDYREKIWDHAAGAIVVTEAGGQVSDIAGRPLEFRHGSELIRNRGIIVTNQHMHDAVVRAIASLGLQEG
jgi:3'(2'), 5'-bisphosphate nucleotidase